MASAQEIREWYATLAAGGSLKCGADEYENSLMLATVRYLNGLPWDQSDPNGVPAMDQVRAALAEQPAPAQPDHPQH